MSNATVWVAAIVVCGVFGLLIGSFLNVVAYRVPAGVSIVSPPSACPNCGRAIRPWDNVPVLSWLVLRGKCRDCAEPISKRYPLVELGTGVGFVAVTVWWWVEVSRAGVSRRLLAPLAGSSTSVVASVLVLVAFLYLAAISVVLGLIDIDVHKLPNRIVLPSYLVVVVLFTAAAALSGDWGALARVGIGLAALWALYAILAIVYPGGMGFGDVKLAGVLGAYLGWVGWGSLVVGAFSAFLLGGLFAIALLIARRANRKSGIPFGPWMLAGAWVGIFFGESLFNGYLTVIGLV
ncbi:prepilin peptidase [Rathayibacter soli]|uniref:prepilin peptidase n=1 Tax=Rathayibacter soli TaxID=3144168 RepID=UPI0027E4A309|nr:prepilin peptidase [Glaciibacter superstes]